MSSALVCVSGGVDSTVALLRSRERFSSVRAVHVRTRAGSLPPEAVSACRMLDVDLTVIQASGPFDELVRNPSIEMLENGLTPNPCAMCNARVKLALPFALLQPEETLVTGHYAGCNNGVLSRGLDGRKDQSYFLSLVPLEILNRCWFPLETSLKPNVLQEALDSGVPFLRRESQDLCFALAGNGVPGDIVDTRGNKISEHQGIQAYTPGQRKGLGAHGSRMYVVRLDRAKNTVVIGDGASLYREKCLLNSINWLGEPTGTSFDCKIQIRYRKPEVPCRITLDGEQARVVFKQPQKAVSPGQIGAVYIDGNVLCGGLIADWEEE